MEKQNEQQIFGSFYLDENEFALSVTYIQEIVNLPEKFTHLPLAPEYLVGLFNLRGVVIPVVDLRKLLDLKSNRAPENQKIAILELDGCCVGLLFDRTGEIFKSIPEERSDFNATGSGQVISGVFKKDAGQRIVQILSVQNLFKLQNIPKDQNGGRRGRGLLDRNRGQRKQCISFMVGSAKCALAISGIQEIIKVSKLSESVLASGCCVGAINLRGATIPIVDFSALLKSQNSESSSKVLNDDKRIVIMRLNEELLGLMVDSVESIVSYFADDLIAFPMMDQKRAEMFLGCISKTDESDVLLLDHGKILSHSEIQEITRGHSSLYKAKTDKDGKSGESQDGKRQTLISFTIDGLFAMDIKDVKEIINYPETMLHPPGLPQTVSGVLNLRGEIVTIIDTRAAGRDEKGQCKILIFKKENLHFGLVVETIDAIITYSESNKAKLPAGLFNKSGGFADGVSEFVEVTDNSKKKHTLMVLSIDSLAKKVVSTLAA